MPGTRSAIRIALLALALVALLGAPAAAAKPATTTSVETARAPGASASATVNYFTITGTPLASRINVYGDATGRLVLVSPEGITAPATPAEICTQDNPTQVSCAAGAITAIKGDLGGGADSFTTDPLLALPIGLALPGPDSPLHGGGGRDRLFGAAEGDLLEGGAGPDSIDGEGADDIIRGGSGTDALNGSAGPDALFGDSGVDRLNGGGGANLCVGGPGSDFARSCLQTKGVP
jgi:hypothetical protein